MNQAQIRKDSVRIAAGVRWASLCERPECIPIVKSQRGAKAAGLRYEKLFAKQFPQALHGQWFRYVDRNGHWYCQPDLIVSLLPRCLVVFEVKYTLTWEAFAQLRQLYLPVVKVAMNAPVIGVVVARNLAQTDNIITATLESAVDAALADEYLVPILHWVGQPMCHTHPLKFKPVVPVQLAFPERYAGRREGFAS